MCHTFITLYRRHNNLWYYKNAFNIIRGVGTLRPKLDIYSILCRRLVVIYKHFMNRSDIFLYDFIIPIPDQ